jgi:hypothetical protein
LLIQFLHGGVTGSNLTQQVNGCALWGGFEGRKLGRWGAIEGRTLGHERWNWHFPAIAARLLVSDLVLADGDFTPARTAAKHEDVFVRVPARARYCNQRHKCFIPRLFALKASNRGSFPNRARSG